MRPEALLFDVFGTVVDWRAGVAAHVGPIFAAAGVEADADAFADAWRAQYQPAMAQVRSGARGYVALDDLHMENLGRALDAFGIGGVFGAAAREELNRAWERLPPWPDSVPGLTRLREKAIVAPCSNGSIAMMTRLARFAGLPWDCVLGADIARDYKPAPAVYRASCAALRLAPAQVMMAAAHEEDLAAARAAGLATAHVPRPLERGAWRDAAPKGEWDVAADDIEDLAARLTG